MRKLRGCLRGIRFSAIYRRPPHHIGTHSSKTNYSKLHHVTPSSERYCSTGPRLAHRLCIPAVTPSLVRKQMTLPTKTLAPASTPGGQFPSNVNTHASSLSKVCAIQAWLVRPLLPPCRGASPCGRSTSQSCARTWPGDKSIGLSPYEEREIHLQGSTASRAASRLW
jgi:hypothetical protein